MSSPTDPRWNPSDVRSFEAADDDFSQAIWRALQDNKAGSSGDAVSLDDEEFETGVHERIEIELGKENRLGTFARTAAAFLPPFLLPKALVPLGTSSGPKASASLLPGLAILPVVTLLMTGYSIYTFVRFLFDQKAAGQQKHNDVDSRYEIAEWWLSHVWHLLFLVAIVIGVALYNFSEALIFCLLVSTVGLVAMLYHLSSVGYASRQEVSRLAYSFLFFAAMIAFQFTKTEIEGLKVQTGFAFVFPILAIGATACHALGRGTRRAWLTSMVVLSLFLIFNFALSQRRGKVPVNIEEALEFVQRTEYPSAFSGAASWDKYANAHTHLKAIDYPMGDWQGLRNGMQFELKASLEKGKFNSLYLLDMHQVGALQGLELSTFDQDYTQRHMFNPLKRYAFRSDDVQVRLMHHKEPLSEEQSNVVGHRIVHTVEEDPTRLNPEKLMDAIHTLELIGQDHRIQALKSVAHELILDCLIHTKNNRKVAFLQYRPKRDGTRRTPKLQEYLTFPYLDGTSDCVQAMEYFGMPEGLPVHGIDAYLHDMSLYYHRRTGGVNMRAFWAKSIQLHLRKLAGTEESPLERPVHWFERILNARLILSALLLSSAGVLFTLRSPIVAREEQPKRNRTHTLNS